jgi:hypothetical protein
MGCAMSDDADSYRKNAVKCIERAKYANSAAQRDRLAALALTWMALAAQTDAIQQAGDGEMSVSRARPQSQFGAAASPD